MKAEIAPFKPVYLDRITQLTNKTNQFNLTTKRYTAAEIENVSQRDEYITLYGRLSDSFGDHGLVSVIIGRKERTALQIDLWLMSCRVLKRDMEFAMLDQLIIHARAAGVRTLCGHYFSTAKNELVRNHYRDAGFELVKEFEDKQGSLWKLELDPDLSIKNKHIRVND
jgi:FkbH-like protein